MSASKARQPLNELSGAFTVAEAAHYVRLSQSTIHRMIKSGRIRPARIGSRTLIRRSDVDALLDPSSQAGG